MAITKVMGIETEYGITVPGAPDSNPVLASSLLVNAFSGRGRKVRWDYEEESPLRDARGFEAAREPETPAEDDLGLANVILTNGARYYVDHAHPEYSSPECLDPRTLVTYDKAGERILAESARRAAELAPGGRRIQVYKNNTDGKGTSYGTHENFLVDRATPFARIVRDLTPFLVSRQVFAGAGSLVRDHHDGSVAFQIAQRSQFFEVEVGLETTLKRPIINTRDEPHADPERYRRLHVIIGDANMNEVATFLKTGSLAIVLNMIEDGVVPGDEWQLANPVQALRAIAKDPTLRTVVERKDGRRLTACELQWHYLEAAKTYLKDREPSHWQLEVLGRWEAVLAQLEDDPLKAARTVDWATKYQLMQQIANRDGLTLEDAKLAVVDIQYHDVSQDKG
ncbi:MAG TPA: depupylase/deamidase Dop, partial [Actinomycetes bacterium]